MKPFYTGKEEEAPGSFNIPIDDDVQRNVSDYRTHLYDEVRLSGQQCAAMVKVRGRGCPLTARASACQVCKNRKDSRRRLTLFLRR